MATAKERREARERASAAQAAQGGKDSPATASTAGGKTPIEKLSEQAATNPGAVQSALGDVARPSSAGAKVTVGCKLGVGYIDLTMCRMDQKFEQNLQGGRIVNEATRVGNPVRIRGTAFPRGTPPKGFPERPEIVAGAALTRGVDKEFWDAWAKQNAMNPLFVNGMIFAHESDDKVRGLAKETEEVRSGLDPIEPGGDARMPRSTRSEIANLEPGVRT